jgi:arylsulfatase A-like enzyme
MYCSSSVCTPSRYNYLTGLYAGRCERFKERFQGEPYNITWNTVIAEQTQTVADALGAAGYRTGYVGKWHTGSRHDVPDLPKFQPDDDPDDPEVDAKLKRYQERAVEQVKAYAGFDYAASIVWGNHEETPPRQTWFHNLDWIAQGGIDFLESCDPGEPFLLYMATTAMHSPSHVKSLDRDPRYTQGGKLDEAPDVLPPRETIKERLREADLELNQINAGITWVDDVVGAVRQKLEEMGVLDDTVFFFCTDHGTEPGKGTLYDYGLHIPMLMRWPEAVTPGTVCDAHMQNVDWLPTVLDCCGVEADGHFDGKSFLPILRNNMAAIHDEMYFEFGYTRGIRTDRWKYIAFRLPERHIEAMKRGELEEAPNHTNMRMQHQMNIGIDIYPGYFDPDQLYDLAADPAEQHNLADDPAYADILAEMKGRLQNYLKTFDHPFELEGPVLEFMQSERFQELTAETAKIGTDYMDWYDHDRMLRRLGLA